MQQEPFGPVPTMPLGSCPICKQGIAKGSVNMATNSLVTAAADDVIRRVFPDGREQDVTPEHLSTAVQQVIPTPTF